MSKKKDAWKHPFYLKIYKRTTRRPRPEIWKVRISSKWQRVRDSNPWMQPWEGCGFNHLPNAPCALWIYHTQTRISTDKHKFTEDCKFMSLCQTSDGDEEGWQWKKMWTNSTLNDWLESHTPAVHTCASAECLRKFVCAVDRFRKGFQENIRWAHPSYHLCVKHEDNRLYKLVCRCAESRMESSVLQQF